MERWIDVKGYESYYQVSDLGRVKRLAGSPYCKKDRILKPGSQPTGYLFVTLCKDGEHKMIRIHRLVMENFCPVDNMENLQVNHLDENRTNNMPNTFQWRVSTESSIYASLDSIINRQS